jgi:hypothetical protein
MHVQVHHLLASIAPLVNYQAISTIRDSLALRHRPRRAEHAGERWIGLKAKFREFSKVLGRNDQQVRRRYRIDVAYDEAVDVAVQLFAGDFAVPYLAEDTVFGHFCLTAYWRTA